MSETVHTVDLAPLSSWICNMRRFYPSVQNTVRRKRNYINLAQAPRFQQQQFVCVLNTFEREVLIFPVLCTDGCCHWGREGGIDEMKACVENVFLPLLSTFLVWQKKNEYILSYSDVILELLMSSGLIWSLVWDDPGCSLESTMR